MPRQPGAQECCALGQPDFDRPVAAARRQIPRLEPIGGKTGYLADVVGNDRGAAKVLSQVLQARRNIDGIAQGREQDAFAVPGGPQGSSVGSAP